MRYLRLTVHHDPLETMTNHQKLARYVAALGALVWIGTLFGPLLASDTMHDVAQIMLLGPLVLVPLTWSIEPTPEPKLARWLATAATWAMGPSSWLVAASFYTGQSIGSALMLLPWLLTTGAMMLHALLSIKRDPSRLKDMEQLAIIASRVYLPGGAVWWISWRAGFELLDFPLLIVLLTAMHFHFAGYMAPWLAAQAGLEQRHTSGKLSLALKLIIACVISGMPLIAIGIQFSAGVELVATTIFTGGVIALGCYNLSQLPSIWRQDKRAAVGVAISALASFVTMVAAILFVAHHITPAIGITIPQMVMVHGWTNGLGFALAGALGWVSLTLTRQRSPSPQEDPQDHSVA